MTDEGISGAAVEKLQSVIPQKSAAEVSHFKYPAKMVAFPYHRFFKCKNRF